MLRPCYREGFTYQHKKKLQRAIAYPISLSSPHLFLRLPRELDCPAGLRAAVRSPARRSVKLGGPPVPPLSLRAAPLPAANSCAEKPTVSTVGGLRSRSLSALAPWPPPAATRSTPLPRRCRTWPRPAVAPAGLPGHVAPGCFTISPARSTRSHCYLADSDTS